MQQVDVKPATKPYSVVHAVTIPRNGVLQWIPPDLDLRGLKQEITTLFISIINKSWGLPSCVIPALSKHERTEGSILDPPKAATSPNCLGT